MKILTQLTILFAICLVGQLLAEWLPFPFPGSVISMIILLLLLLFKVLKPKHIGIFLCGGRRTNFGAVHCITRTCSGVCADLYYNHDCDLLNDCIDRNRCCKITGKV